MRLDREDKLGKWYPVLAVLLRIVSAPDAFSAPFVVGYINSRKKRHNLYFLCLGLSIELPLEYITIEGGVYRRGCNFSHLATK